MPIFCASIRRAKAFPALQFLRFSPVRFLQSNNGKVISPVPPMMDGSPVLWNRAYWGQAKEGFHADHLYHQSEGRLRENNDEH